MSSEPPRTLPGGSLNRLENFIFNFLKECGPTACLYYLCQQVKNLNHFQNALFMYVSLERLSYLLKCHLYLKGTGEVCLLFQKTLLHDVCHHRKGLQIQNTCFFWEKNVELTFMFDKSIQNFSITNEWFKIFSWSFSISIKSIADSLV